MDGDIYVRGNNLFGQLGLGKTGAGEEKWEKAASVTLSEGFKFTQVVCGPNATFLVSEKRDWMEDYVDFDKCE